MVGSTRTNTLHLDFSDTECSANDWAIIRKISNSIAADRMLVERVVTQPGNAVLSVFFVTHEPEQLWAKIQDEIFGHPDLGERLFKVSSALWQGEDYLNDHIWIHRFGVNDGVVDGFEKRTQCEHCDGWFHIDRAKSSCCPYCECRISVLD